MYYDEEQERREDKRNKILRTPINDFELSVRSRNCLSNMGIRSLGDLVNKSEAELLSFKNFGETSLMEVKQMLAQKGLRLGQGKIEGRAIPTPRPVEASPEELERPINALHVSARHVTRASPSAQLSPSLLLSRPFFPFSSFLLVFPSLSLSACLTGRPCTAHSPPHPTPKFSPSSTCAAEPAP